MRVDKKEPHNFRQFGNEQRIGWFSKVTVLSLLSAQGPYVSHFRWALIDMLENSAKDQIFVPVV